MVRELEARLHSIGNKIDTLRIEVKTGSDSFEDLRLKNQHELPGQPSISRLKCRVTFSRAELRQNGRSTSARIPFVTRALVSGSGGRRSDALAALPDDSRV